MQLFILPQQPNPKDRQIPQDHRRPSDNMAVKKSKKDANSVSCPIPLKRLKSSMHLLPEAPLPLHVPVSQINRTLHAWGRASRRWAAQRFTADNGEIARNIAERGGFPVRRNGTPITSAEEYLSMRMIYQSMWHHADRDFASRSTQSWL